MKNLLILSLLLLVGCETNFFGKKDPYPEGGEYNPNPRAPRREVNDAMSASFPTTIDYKEGIFLSTIFDVSVPEPGKPILTVKGLPAGAIYNPKTFKLDWQPSYFDGNNPKDPSIKTRDYKIVVQLTSSDPSKEAIRKEITLRVADVPQKFEVKGYSDVEMYEGVPGEYEFKIINKDFPKGPFKVLISDAPSNIKLIEKSPDEYVLKLSPDYYMVNLLTDKCGNTFGCKRFPVKLQVSNPAGHQTPHAFNLEIKDKRLDPKIITPGVMTQGLDINFQVVGYDINKEIAPILRMVGDRPSFGNFEFSTVENEESSSTVLNVSWTDIPPSMNGKSQKLQFETCVHKTRSSLNNCKDADVEINVVVRDHVAPTISRKYWKNGEILYLSYKETTTKTVSVIDNENTQSRPAVKVMPKSMRKYVKWNNGTFKLTFDKSGLFAFDLIATSDYNISSAESFVVEVFKEDRAETLLFADSTRDAEVKFYKSKFENLDIMNPAIQAINLRNISGRDNLIIGTSTLLDTSLDSKILDSISRIRNIIVTSPLMNNLPNALLTEINRDYGVAIMGRYSDLTHLPNINTMEFVSRRDFQRPNSTVQLSLTASAESHDPTLFSTGVDTSNCEAVLELASKNRSFRADIGIICDRTNGGRLALMGTEFADLKVSQQDSDIPYKWLDKMLTTNLGGKKGNK